MDLKVQFQLNESQIGIIVRHLHNGRQIRMEGDWVISYGKNSKLRLFHLACNKDTGQSDLSSLEALRA